MLSTIKLTEVDHDSALLDGRGSLCCISENHCSVLLDLLKSII